MDLCVERTEWMGGRERMNLFLSNNFLLFLSFLLFLREWHVEGSPEHAPSCHMLPLEDLSMTLQLLLNNSWIFLKSILNDSWMTLEQIKSWKNLEWLLIWMTWGSFQKVNAKKTYGIVHMLVNPPLLTYSKSLTFLCLWNDF